MEQCSDSEEQESVTPRSNQGRVEASPLDANMWKSEMDLEE